jgi:uncharacterized oligopeptide transporter (OPT) family protein
MLELVKDWIKEDIEDGLLNDDYLSGIGHHLGLTFVMYLFFIMPIAILLMMILTGTGTPGYSEGEWETSTRAAIWILYLGSEALIMVAGVIFILIRAWFKKIRQLLKR